MRPSPCRVSMPPRRFCFAGPDGRRGGRSGFQCHHGVSASKAILQPALDSGRVSMPPRRFCFSRRRRSSWSSTGVSMPPRRFCFRALSAPGDPPGRVFQCHHGVSASAPGRRVAAAPTWVSMPPWRFCFDREREEWVFDPRRFNATTAFLLHWAGPAKGLFSKLVSMPPRRFCFWSPWRPSMTRSGVSMPPRRFCFQGPQTLWAVITAKFQCHHGVSASVPAPRGCLVHDRFQCHHGVSASSSRWSPTPPGC